MEYTKDMILTLQYEDKPEQEEKKFWKGAIKKHKWISLMVVMLMILTVIDAILMVQFYEVLKEL